MDANESLDLCVAEQMDATNVSALESLDVRFQLLANLADDLEASCEQWIDPAIVSLGHGIETPSLEGIYGSFKQAIKRLLKIIMDFAKRIGQYVRRLLGSNADLKLRITMLEDKIHETIGSTPRQTTMPLGVTGAWLNIHDRPIRSPRDVMLSLERTFELIEISDMVTQPIENIRKTLVAAFKSWRPDFTEQQAANWLHGINQAYSAVDVGRVMRSLGRARINPQFPTMLEGFSYPNERVLRAYRNTGSYGTDPAGIYAQSQALAESRIQLQYLVNPRRLSPETRISVMTHNEMEMILRMCSKVTETLTEKYRKASELNNSYEKEITAAISNLKMDSGNHMRYLQRGLAYNTAFMALTNNTLFTINSFVNTAARHGVSMVAMHLRMY